MSRYRTMLVRGAIAALAALVAAGLFYAARSPLLADSSAPAPPTFPTLPTVRVSCPEGSDHALHAARSALQIAEARMQRYAFAPSEGRLALEQLAVARACAQLAGDAPLVASASRRHAQLREQIERDASDRLRRYEALKHHERLREAAQDIAFLIELGWPEQGELADALRRDRELLESTP